MYRILILSTAISLGDFNEDLVRDKHAGECFAFLSLDERHRPMIKTMYINNINRPVVAKSARDYINAIHYNTIDRALVLEQGVASCAKIGDDVTIKSVIDDYSK